MQSRHKKVQDSSKVLKVALLGDDMSHTTSAISPMLGIDYLTESTSLHTPIIGSNPETLEIKVPDERFTNNIFSTFLPELDSFRNVNTYLSTPSEEENLRDVTPAFCMYNCSYEISLKFVNW